MKLAKASCQKGRIADLSHADAYNHFLYQTADGRHNVLVHPLESSFYESVSQRAELC